MKTIDPLGDVSLLWLREHGETLCTCRRPEFAMHTQKCGITPEYAKTIESLGFSPLEVDTSIGFSMFNLVWKDWP